MTQRQVSAPGWHEPWPVHWFGQSGLVPQTADSAAGHWKAPLKPGAVSSWPPVVQRSSSPW
jgi:hypothetical protein